MHDVEIIRHIKELLPRLREVYEHLGIVLIARLLLLVPDGVAQLHGERLQDLLQVVGKHLGLLDARALYQHLRLHVHVLEDVDDVLHALGFLDDLIGLVHHVALHV